MMGLFVDFILSILPVSVLTKLVIPIERYYFVDRVGEVHEFYTVEDLQEAIDNTPEVNDGGDFDKMFWVLNDVGMRAVFDIARSEEDDDIALLTVTANTDFTTIADEEDDDDFLD